MEPETSSKKKFDKKKWREKKYNKAFRVNEWEEKRQKILLRKLHREVKTEVDITNSELKRKNIQPERISGLKAAHLEYKKIVEEKKKKKEERLKKQKEMQEALERYKKKKTETFKKLSKKTKKGQPLMKDRLELMLEKVKKSVSS